MIRIVRYLVWLAEAGTEEIRWAAKAIGYKIRPYDMLADRRRWCWQPRERCQWSQRQDGEP